VKYEKGMACESNRNWRCIRVTGRKHTTSTTREVLINDAPLSSRKTPKSSPKFFYDELVTKIDSSWNERH